MPTKKIRKRCVKCRSRLTLDQMTVYSMYGSYRYPEKYICRWCKNKGVQQDPAGHLILSVQNPGKLDTLQEVDTVKLL